MRTVLLVASPWEARAWSSVLPPEASLVITGMGAAKARTWAERAARENPDLVINTGFAGALSTEIRAGDLVLDQARSDASWSEKISAAAHKNHVPCHSGTFFCSNRILMTSGEKRRKGLETGAIAVEMESQGIFEVLRERKIPFLSVRAVSDEASRDLPPSLGSLGPDGAPNLKFILKLLGRPREWGGFFHLASGSKKAGKNLNIVLKEFFSHG